MIAALRTYRIEGMPVSDTLSKGLRSAGQRARGLGAVLQGFKDFISRGNAIELAVGVVIGAAFGAVVSSLQNALISPLIGWIFGQPDLSQLWDIGPYTWREDPANPATPIHVGVIINAVVTFLITAAAVYFLIILPLNKLAERRKRGIEEEPKRPSEDILLLQQIRDLLAAQAGPSAAHHAEPHTAGDAGATPATDPSSGLPRTPRH